MNRPILISTTSPLSTANVDNPQSWKKCYDHFGKNNPHDITNLDDEINAIKHLAEVYCKENHYQTRKKNKKLLIFIKADILTVR